MPRPMRPAPYGGVARASSRAATRRRAAALQRGAVEAGEAERLERARPVAQVAAEEAAGHGEQAVRDRRVDAAPARHRGEEGQAELGVLGDVAVRVQVDVLAPVARVDQLLVRVAVHPAVVGVVVGERIVRRAVAERLAHRDPLEVEPVGDGAHRRLRAFGVDVPALEVLQRRRVHHHQRRMDHRPGVHQRARQRIAAAMHRRIGAARSPPAPRRPAAPDRRRSAGAPRGSSPAPRAAPSFRAR